MLFADAGGCVRMRLISESNTDNQLILTHSCACTQSLTAISIDSFSFGFIQVNRINTIATAVNFNRDGASLLCIHCAF
jgi:hypothetical protein